MTPTIAKQQSLVERYRAAFPRSRELHRRAKDVFPNGVTHDVRHLEPFPVYIDRAEGSRNASAFQVAAFLVRDFGLSPRVASAYLAEWNAGNEPPLGAGELRDVLGSAVKHGRRTVGCAHQASPGGASA